MCHEQQGCHYARANLSGSQSSYRTWTIYSMLPLELSTQRDCTACSSRSYFHACECTLQNPKSQFCRCAQVCKYRWSASGSSDLLTFSRMFASMFSKLTVGRKNVSGRSQPVLRTPAAMRMRPLRGRSAIDKYGTMGVCRMGVGY